MSTKISSFALVFVFTFLGLAGIFTKSVNAQVSAYAPCELILGAFVNTCDAPSSAVCYENDQPTNWIPPANLDQLCENIYSSSGVCPTEGNGLFYNYSVLICSDPAISPTPIPTPLPGADPGTCRCDSTFGGACFVPPGGNGCYSGFEPRCASSAQSCQYTNPDSCTCVNTSAPPTDTCSCYEWAGDYYPGSSDCLATNVPMCNTDGSCICGSGEDCDQIGEPCCGFTCAGGLQCLGIGFDKTCGRACERIEDCPDGQMCFTQVGVCIPIDRTVARIKIFCNEDGIPTTDPSGELWTAVGCIPIVDDDDNALLTPLAAFWLRIGLSVGGGLAMLIIAISGILIKVSVGNPQKIRVAQELMLGAISALILIIFSAFLLRVVGISILGIPGL